jgi:hypothetical protein
MTSTNGVCPAGTTPGAPGSSCTQPNVCQTSPRPCCNGITGQCTLVSPASPCPTGTLPGPAGSTVCSPNPCPFPNAATAQTCLDCTYVNGAFDGVNGQLSHLGGGYPRGGKAADDFYLTEDFMHDVKTFSATLLTNTSLGLVKPKGEIWSDCNGCPGTLLYTFDNPLIVETGLDIGPAYDGRLLRIVHVTFDVTRETIPPTSPTGAPPTAPSRARPRTRSTAISATPTACTRSPPGAARPRGTRSPTTAASGART